MKHLASAGETIVEVLIATAVIGSVLSGAYAITSRSLSNTRQSQERGEALKVAQGQIERLRGVINTTGYAKFCLKDNNSPSEITSSNVPNTSIINDDFNVYKTANCVYDFQGQTNNNGRYHTVITRNAATDTYAVFVRWDRAGGSGREELIMRYRAYPE